MTHMGCDIQIHVNGQARPWRGGATVADLLQELDIKTERVAVELNLEILDRAVFGERVLNDGDRLEILGFIGGGTF
jgi:thiamine biosynthesis protein ThiS